MAYAIEELCGWEFMICTDIWARIIHLLHHFLHINFSFVMPAGLLSHMDGYLEIHDCKCN